MNFLGYEIKCDTKATKLYRDKYNEQCSCNQCKNYRKLFENNYPKIVKLLDKFGINIMFPLEIMDLKTDTANNKLEYVAYYSVKGSLPTDKIDIKYDGVNIILRNWNTANDAYANTGMEKPYFIVEISDIFLPNSIK